MTTTSIVFSKDRALQLDLMINSVKMNLGIHKHMAVLYTCSKIEYEKSYEILKREHPDVLFVQQGLSFYHDLLTCLYAYNDKFITLFTDDNIVYRKSQTTPFDLDSIFHNTLIFCMSLRLGINTTKRDYGDGVLRNDNIPPSITGLGDRHMYWNRTSVLVGGYWAYPLSVDGHIYRREDISYMFHTMNGWPESTTVPQNPNALESYMQRFFFEYPIGMAAEKQSCVVNSPNNRVQNSHKNLFGTQYLHDIDYINQAYLKGVRINPAIFNNINITCPHQELNLLEGLSL